MHWEQDFAKRTGLSRSYVIWSYVTGRIKGRCVAEFVFEMSARGVPTSVVAFHSTVYGDAVPCVESVRGLISRIREARRLVIEHQGVIDDIERLIERFGIDQLDFSRDYVYLGELYFKARSDLAACQALLRIQGGLEPDLITWRDKLRLQEIQAKQATPAPLPQVRRNTVAAERPPSRMPSMFGGMSAMSCPLCHKPPVYCKCHGVSTS